MTNAGVAQELTLLRRTGGGEDFGAEALRNLHRHESDAARTGVDQDALAGAQPGDFDQAMKGRGERVRQRDGGGGRQIVRDRRGQRLVRDDDVTEAAPADSHEPVAGAKPGDAGAEAAHDAAELEPEWPRVSRDTRRAR